MARVPTSLRNRTVVVPPSLDRQAAARPLLAPLRVTDIGFYPRAGWHRWQRERGIDHLVLMACLQGRGWAEAAGQRVDLHPGDLLLLPPGSAHAYGADPDEPWTIAWCHLAGSALPAWQEALAAPGPGPSRRRFGDPGEFLPRFEAALAPLEQEGPTPAALLRAAGAAHALLAYVADPRLEAGTRADPIEPAVAYLRQHLDRPVAITALAAQVGLSPSRLRERFRTRFGMAPSVWHTRLRLQRAAELLEDGDLPIATIAARVGYDDPFLFSRRFRALFGRPPRAWRRRDG